MYASIILTYRKVAVMRTDLGWYVMVVGVDEGLSSFALGGFNAIFNRLR